MKKEEKKGGSKGRSEGRREETWLIAIQKRIK